MRPASTIFIAVFSAALAAIGCSYKVDLYCDEDTPCEDFERPFCDLEGTYPASKGIARTCIPDPFGADAGVDATVADASMTDADTSSDGAPAIYTLTVTPAGTGAGTVVSNPFGINCGATCAADFEEGTTVRLTATPESNSVFTGWSGGGCTDPTFPCDIVLGDDTTVTATFTLKEYELTVTPGGDGTGGVTSAPPGIDTGNSDFSEFYTHGTEVALTAAATGLSNFGGWSGDCSGPTSPCNLTMDSDKNVGAAFDLDKVSLLVSVEGSGGTVTSGDGLIDCPDGCSASYDAGSDVTLTANYNPSLTIFVGWDGGGCTGSTDDTCQVTVNTTTSVTATFTPVTYDLTVNKTGSGDGLVSSVDPGINCGATCQATFNAGTEVTLSAVQLLNHTFTGWSGGGCSGTGSCVVTMNSNTTVQANFESPKDIDVVVDGNGGGNVTSDPFGISCGGTCLATFSWNTDVTLTALPDADSTFIRWQGDCAGVLPTCDLTMTADKNATATFNQRGEHLGTKAFGTGEHDVGIAAAYDAAGNLYVAGNFDGTLDLSGGSDPMTSAGSLDYFVAKFSPTGAHIWSVSFGGSTCDDVLDMAVNDGGDVLLIVNEGVTSEFAGTCMAPIPDQAGTFTVKRLSGSSGSQSWANPYTGTDLIISEGSIAWLSATTMVIGGTYQGTVNFGGGNLTSVDGSNDIFFLWLSAAGAYSESASYGTSDGDSLRDLHVGGDGNIAFVGAAGSNLDLGGGSLGEFSSGYVAKFSPAGTHAWSEKYSAVMRGVAADAAGNAYVTGHFGPVSNLTNLGGDTLYTAADGAINSFVAKYAHADGAHVWSFAMGSTKVLEIGNMEGGRAIAVDGRGFVTVTGFLAGPADLGGGTLTGPTAGLTIPSDVYAASYDGATGAHRWSTVFGGEVSSNHTDICLSPIGNATLTGAYRGTFHAEGATFPNQGNMDIFVVTYGP